MAKRKIISLKKLKTLGERLRAERKKVVFTAGAFDLLHIGQIRYLAKAKDSGDVLVVGVASDKSQRKLKGPPFPIMDEGIRAEMVAFLRVVDFVVPGVDRRDLSTPLKRLRPHLFFTTKQAWEKGKRLKKEAVVVKSFGGRVVRTDYVKPYLSTADIAEKVALIRIGQIINQRLGGEGSGPIYGKS